MNVGKDKIMSIVIESVTEIVNEWEVNCNLPIISNTKLWGDGSGFDSMNIVNVIVRIEEKVSEVYHFQITIANEKALSQSNSPFKSIETLTSYIVDIVAEMEY